MGVNRTFGVSEPAPGLTPSAGTVLFLTTVWPGARRSGGESVSQAFIDALRADGRRVIVVAYRRRGEPDRGHHDDAVVGERPIETRDAGSRVLLWLARAIASGLPYSAAKYVSRPYRRRVEKAVGEGADLVVIDHAQSAWVMHADHPFPPHVYLAHNIESDLYAANAAMKRGFRRSLYAREARRAEVLEQRVLSGAVQVWALSAQDASTLEALGAPVSVRAFAPPPSVPRAAAAPDTDIVLLGRWSWAANAVGLQWFADEVIGHLPVALRVEVAGSGAEVFHGRPANVTLHGPVEDAGRFLSRGRVIAVPARAGAGVQIKTLDAIASGRPVVATSLAVRGLRDFPSTVRIADDPAAFADALAQAASSPPSPADVAAVEAWMGERRRGFRADVQDALCDAFR